MMMSVSIDHLSTDAYCNRFYRGLASHVVIVALVDIQHFLLLKVLASTRL